MSDTTFAIDTAGAYVTKLAADGQPILFTRQRIGDKLRGGSHVCLPNFGPDVSGELAQHGFGRVVDWKLTKDEPNIKELTLPSIAGVYTGLQATLRYDCSESGMLMRLTVVNTGRQPLRVAPAFHPYFAVPDESDVQLNGELLDLSTYAGTEYIKGTRQTLQVGERTLTLHSDELTTWALWTDQAAGYFCVEPSLRGQSFRRSEPDTEELLQPDEQRTYDFRISWS